MTSQPVRITILRFVTLGEGMEDIEVLPVTRDEATRQQAKSVLYDAGFAWDFDRKLYTRSYFVREGRDTGYSVLEHATVESL